MAIAEADHDSEQSGAADRLDPLRRVTLDDTTFFIDTTRPVAALRDERTGVLRYVSWADAPQPLLSMSATVFPSVAAVWVVYQTGDGSDLVHIPTGTHPTALPAVRIGVDGSVDWVDLGRARVISADCAPPATPVHGTARCSPLRRHRP